MEDRASLTGIYALPGWRKTEDWQRRLKGLERLISHVVYGGGVCSLRCATI